MGIPNSDLRHRADHERQGPGTLSATFETKFIAANDQPKAENEDQEKAMLSGLYKIGSKLMLENQAQEMHAQNLAGSGLSGFKGQRLIVNSFQQDLEAVSDQQNRTYGVDVGLPKVDFSQGSLKSTGRSLDFALNGDGFFQVETQDGGTLFTRNGNFILSPAGILQTQEGHTVLGENGPIQFVPEDQVQKMIVTREGDIMVPTGENNEMRQAGRIQLGQFPAMDELTRISANYFAAPDDQGLAPSEDLVVSNGYLEQSNISPVQQMAAMIQSLREFEAGHKMIQTLNEISRKEGQTLG